MPDPSWTASIDFTKASIPQVVETFPTGPINPATNKPDQPAYAGIE